MHRPDPNMRVSNAEREAIIAKLHAATEEGRLDLDEFADRSRQAYEARTYGEVERLLADLPEATGAVAVPAPASPGPAHAPAELRLNPTGSSVERRGEWIVPPKIVVTGSMSSVKLDCRHATITGGTVDVNVDCNMSSLEIILPAGAYAVDDGIEATFGSVANRAPYKGGTGVRFTVSGRARLGSVKIRHEYRFLWWRW
ncbi:DUF1707 domain-containing protein [Glycomyces sp. TRM65418]|uniref:DUF1707 SHOCT-like domain-containing protein n=1 Tax=Glycomyces sp. TRM65418 TaxID=2867006 RepID=UPI001CE6ABA7|nr:DUF1707 domain-containing protein [Glycomyces sp. TRM65418]MCC3763951.1 DUF1707 domain-containing protein [Glycomyces sp. TRM65418]QZD53651.1 DUF1707 domain-containing protein [Glycomyces sp. TRM65418]